MRTIVVLLPCFFQNPNILKLCTKDPYFLPFVLFLSFRNTVFEIHIYFGNSQGQAKHRQIQNYRNNIVKLITYKFQTLQSIKSFQCRKNLTARSLAICSFLAKHLIHNNRKSWRHKPQQMTFSSLKKTHVFTFINRKNLLAFEINKAKRL